jgi:hypothetical protein
MFNVDDFPGSALPEAYDGSQYQADMSAQPLVDSSDADRPSQDWRSWGGGSQQDIPEVDAIPSMHQDAENPAGKLPYPQNGPVGQGGGGVDQALIQRATDEYNSPPAQQAPPVPPSSAAGAPSPPSAAQAALSRYQALSAPTPPGDPSHWYSKIGSAIVNATNATPEEHYAALHPNYARKLGQYNAEKADLANQIKLAESVEKISGDEETKKTSSQARMATAQNTLLKNGLTEIPDGAPVPPDMKAVLVTPDGKKLYRNEHFGQFKVTQAQSDAVGGTLEAGSWQPLEFLKETVTAGGQQSKPTKETTVPVLPETALAFGVKATPNENGMVDLPQSFVLEKYKLDNSPEKKTTPNNTLLGMRASGATTGNKEIDAMTPAQAERAREKPPVTQIINPGEKPGIEANAQMIANYQTQPLNGFVMRSPEGRAIMARVKEINPDYHAEYYNNFNKTESDATTGKIGTSANALNTMMGHLSVLNDASEALRNNNVQVLNRLANAIGVQFGRDPVTTYKTIVHRIGPEVTKAYIASGGSMGERGTNEEDFDPKLSPDQIKNNIGISAVLADSKIKALQDQYQRGTYGRGQQKLISEEANAARQRLAGQASHGGKMSDDEIRTYLKKAGWTSGPPTPEQKRAAQALAQKDGKQF